MEELSIAEKAMRYDVAVKKAKSKITGDKDHILYEDDVIEMFPELKESEDERVRKELLKHLKEGADGYEPAGNSEDYKRWLGWFKKQGETFTKKDVDDAYLKGVCDAKHELEKQGEKKAAIKLERDDNGEPVLTPFEAELFSMMSEAWQGYSFGEEVNFAKIVKKHSIELLERAKEQNPAWSEEDRDYYDAIIAKLELTRYDALLTDNQMAFLKSIKDRYFWKPTDAQIASLTIACDRNDRIGFDLTQLLRDLKKLKE